MLRTLGKIRRALPLVSLFTATLVVSGQNAQEQTEVNPALERVQAYAFNETDEDGKAIPLQLIEQSFLSWSNPVFGTTGGGLFVWVNHQRPSAILKTYKTKNDRWFEQMRSFSTRRIIARESAGEDAFWSPDRGAEPMKPLPKAPAPAATAVARLVQMKALHREFTVTGDLANAGGPQELRVYPRPLYRYKTDEVIDGAVLAFVQGTGPDMILILEARESNGEAKWYYSLGSIGIYKVDVDYEGQRVWSEPRRTAVDTRPTDLYDGRRLPL